RWTADAAAEMSAQPLRPPFCCLTAEIGAALRIAAPSARSGRPVTAEFVSGPAASRVRAVIAAAAGRTARLTLIPADRSRPRYLLSIPQGPDADRVIRQAGLADADGQPLVGMPRAVIAGRRCDLAAAWRGAFLAGGVLDNPLRRHPYLTVTCPSAE